MKALDAVSSDEDPQNETQEGQGLAEYALILGLIAIVAIAALIFLGATINDLMTTIGSTIDTST